jgi:(1->4)-alpha-D-glucan 1-alpha-D-glucosylmutase
MAVPTPVRLNAALWSILRDGPGSPYSLWFDIDWAPTRRVILMPVLGNRIGIVLARREITVDRTGPEPVLRYFDHEFPVRPGTEHLPLRDLVDRQWYRLAWWRVGDEELNYRRFFDIDTLAAVWVVVEKILEGEEELPADWSCAGTTGYDALKQIGGLFVDPAGAAPLAALLTEVTGQPPDFGAVVEEAKHQVIEASLYAEVHRLVELLVEVCAEDVGLRDHTRRHLETAVVELLVAFDRYRGYVVPGESAPVEAVEAVERATELARARVPEEAQDTLHLVRDLVLGRPVGTEEPPPQDRRRRDELIVRFQQTCGPVMAKGLEDTAFYRWNRLVALNEVGGDPTAFGVPPEAFHAFAQRLQGHWPDTMTTLSTHDTKRSEDVRARLYALAELTSEWAEAVRGWTEASSRHRSPDGWPDWGTIYLIWQTLVGTWGQDGPLSIARLGPYLTKATREAKQHTSWTNPEPGYDEAVQAFAARLLADQELCGSIGDFSAELDAPARVAVLGQKLVQLAMPGVPDVYQGCELVDLSLVDPDNRREIDFVARRARLTRLDGGTVPADLDDEKLLVTSRTLRLRRERPTCFVGPGATYRPVPTSTGNAVAFARGDPDGAAVVAVATRLPVALARHGGWGEHVLTLPDGTWTDRFTGHTIRGGTGSRLADLLADLPVALLARD